MEASPRRSATEASESLLAAAYAVKAPEVARARGRVEAPRRYSVRAAAPCSVPSCPSGSGAAAKRNSAAPGKLANTGNA